MITLCVEFSFQVSKFLLKSFISVFIEEVGCELCPPPFLSDFGVR